MKKAHSRSYLMSKSKAWLVDYINTLEYNLESKTALYERCVKVNEKLFEELGNLDAEIAKKVMNSFIGKEEIQSNRQKTGKWERHYSRPGVYTDLFWHCSACGGKSSNQYAYLYFKFCPYCGAKMEVPE